MVSTGNKAGEESLFALLQSNVLDRQTRKTCEDRTGAVISWNETAYHRRRRQRAPGMLNPIECEEGIGHNTIAIAG